MLDSDGSEEEEEEEGTTGGVLRTRLLSSTESTDSMLNTEESSEKVRSTPSGTEDDTGINIVIEKDETLIAKTTRSGDAIIYGIELKEKAYAMFETQSPLQQVELTTSEINSEQPNAPIEDLSQGEQTTVEKGEKEENAKNRSVKI
ncbi:hypothetical protein FRACYDRAFT_235235 [Fragilariopsis cylindrus CCMP1102]|uniref:Uncharacterized protein n=1 Tax=Fragilariopsis cylindrus CCMP1102 TaxID=635003 RepID=A0A1E7FTX7_9STRA|nr:hypothetical protein FRACYDRAFT_235235 [Fragilariopsis cylindrus CCMP1102]|eukprot:OEU21609.1 hypothetical protein FRACYDRAFT_235235 [Fragilariopsis cylindrus CCMP1102]